MTHRHQNDTVGLFETSEGADASGVDTTLNCSSLDASKDIDWENRVLCRDESCIGVIGPDGRCKECGLAYHEDSQSGRDEASLDASCDNMPELPEARTEIQNDWENRVLCRDESCIGVIGPDGRCKECGKPCAPDA